MDDMTVMLISYFGIVLATVAYFASNVGLERRGYRRHRGWLALMGVFLGITAAAVVYLVAG